MERSSVLLVEALYQFKGKNNDELCFKKGSIITVTQNDDDTWWEGTLDGNTGWFPANYVRPYKSTGANDGSSSSLAAPPPTAAVSPSSEQQMYRALVLRNLLDSERQHITDLNLLINSCLKPLANNKLLCANEYNTLVRNLERVVSVHKELLSRLEAEGEKPSSDQRVGGVFLTMAGDILSKPHQQYCSHHPRAVLYLQEHKDEVNRCVESTSLYGDDAAADGAALSGGSPHRRRPGLLLLTTGLSRPFRRLQQYPSLLQEMHRHLPEAHRDRGDAQRAAKVMADMAASCSALRRQKELQLEVVSGHVVGWERGTLAVLGEVLTMGSVAVLPDHTDRYLVVFPNHLVILSVSPRMSNFIFQSQHSLSEILCCKLEDCDQYKNGFEITGGKMDRLVAVCQSKADQQRWVDNLSHHSDIRNGVRASGGVVAMPPPALPTKAAGGGSAKNLASSSSKANSGPPTSVKGQPPLPPHKQVPPPLLPPAPKGLGEVSLPASSTSHVSGCLSACTWDLYDGCYSDTYEDLYLCGPLPEEGPVSLDWYRCCNKGAIHSGNEGGEGRLRLTTEKRELVYMNPNEVECIGDSSRFSLANEQDDVLISINSVPETTAHTPIAGSNPFDFLEDEPFETNKPYFVEICVDCDLPICCQDLKSGGVNDSYNAKGSALHCACLNSSGAFLRFLPDPSYIIKDESHRQSGSRRKPPYPYSYDKRKEPYVVLTRYFRKLYRRKVITRAMLRALSGDLYDLSSAAGVALRRKGRQDASDELTEEDEDVICLVLAGDDKRDEALYDENEQMKNVKDTKGKCEEFRNVENLKKEWEREHLKVLLSPIPVRKVYNEAKDTRLPDGYFKSNLHKWNYSPCSEGEFSSRLLNPLVDRSFTSKSSNPCGFTNIFSADESDGSFSLSDKRRTYTKASASTCGDFLSVPATVKQASLDSPNHPSISRRPIIVPKILIENFYSDSSSSAHKPMYKTYVPIILKMPLNKSVCESDNCYQFSLTSNPMDGLTSNNTFDEYSGEERVCADPPLENIYDIVTNSSSAGNICNKTIYERGSSEEEACRPARKFETNRECKSLLFFKKKPSLNFYFSSCSAEDTEEDQSDFYASCREFYSSCTHSLSRSEPNIYYNDIAEKPEKQYASHYVQLVCHVGATSPDLKCRCETFSHRSSDSGMVDVHFGRHVDDCPFKSDVTLGSSITPKRMEYSRFRDGCSPAVVSESGTLPHSCSGAHHFSSTMVVSNYGENSSVTSNIVSTNQKLHACRSSIVVSTPPILQLDAESVPPEDTATQSDCLLTEEQVEVSTYKSGLYAHWWMKATISPEDIRSGAQSKHIAEIAMTNNDAYFKGKSSKASFHVFKPEKRILNDSRYGRGQSVATQEVVNESLFGRSVLEDTRTDEYSECESLTPKHGESLRRDPSYESYSSLITIKCDALPSVVGSCTTPTNASMVSAQQNSVPYQTSTSKLCSNCDLSDPSATNPTLNRQPVTSCLVTTPSDEPNLVSSPDTAATSKPVKADSAVTTPICQPVLGVCPVTAGNSIQAVGSSHGADSSYKFGCYKSCVIGVSVGSESHVKTEPPDLSKHLLQVQEISHCGARPERLVSRTYECKNLTDSMVCSWPHIGSAVGCGDDGGEGESACATVATETERLNNPMKTDNVESECASNVGYEHLGESDGLCLYTIHMEGEETLV